MSLTWLIRLFCLVRIPLLALCWPRVLRIDNQSAAVSVRKNLITQNHVGSMYFGALAMGAELSTAVRLLQRMRDEKLPLGFIFKDASFQFLKRAEDEVVFHTDEVPKVDSLIEEALRTGERCDRTISGRAFLKKNPQETLMTYSVTLSLKKTKKGFL